MLYFDHNATTFVAPEVAEAMDAAIRQVFGNASSTHRAGQIARDRLENARHAIAKFINATPNEIVFTSGGTESNNLSILGLIGASHGQVLTTTIEHPSVLDSCRHLKNVNVVAVDEISRNITDETVLVSVMHANNETGTLQPITDLARLVQERRAAGQRIYLHSDGVQAIGKIDVDVRALGVDLYSMSAHKVFAPKGIGALFVRRGVPLHGIQHGGRHERERRAGTENVPGAMAFARALELCGNDSPHVAGLRDYFEGQVLRRIDDVEINGVGTPRLPNTSNLLFRGVSAETLVIALDMRGMAVSTGSACSSGSVEPSHVL
ncbi:MAG TPA: cysteine desulfurase family protein, partial [Bryobacteraceae bacterium]|nr:cysteine desulfurase family protein [Bryobacteraceae bacterium]